MATFSRITPFLWYDTQAEEAAEFYTTLFPNSAVSEVLRYGAAGPGPEGSVMTVRFQLDGLPIVALNGGPEYRLTEAFSLQVSCQTQAEVDALWDRLSDGGEEGPCGWCKDRFGLSWQIVPTALLELLGDRDRDRSQRAVKAMLGMGKLDAEALRRAADGADVP